MNKAYRPVWNASSGTWVAAQENARAGGKGGRVAVAGAVKALLLVGASGLATGAQASIEKPTDVADAPLSTLLDVTSAASMAPAEPVIAAASSGSGVNDAAMIYAYKTAAYYSQVNGLGDGTGSTPPSDVARVGHVAGAIAVGSYATTSGTNGVAVGSQAYTPSADAVALGAGSVANQQNTVSVGNDGTASFKIQNADGSYGTVANPANTRRIVNMAAGHGDTDAVNVAQLRSVTAALGAGATLDANGALKAPAYVVSGATYGDVGRAVAALDAGSVKYDGQSHASITLDGASGTVLSNVAPGALNRDAVNVGQLRAAGLVVDPGGNVTNAFVAYDDLTKSVVTLGGAQGTRITHLAPGGVSGASSDAINGAQLYRLAGSTAGALGGGATVDAAGGIAAPAYKIAGATYNDVGHALQALDVAATAGPADGVKYDTSAHDRVTFGGVRGTTLSNVAAGKADTDALNVAQLKAVGARFDSLGSLANAFVAYDDLSRASITLGGANGTRISNVAAGTGAADAVNVAQLRAVGTMLGGGADLGADGAPIAPTYHMQGGTQRTVGSALDTLDSGLTSLAQRIDGSGIDLVAQDPVSRRITVGAATNGDTVDFGGTAGARSLTGVASGAVSKTSTDAVNGAQLFVSAASTVAALGGGATVNTDGSLAGPSYAVGGTTVHDVGSAITNLDGRVTKNSYDITNLQTSITQIAGSVANAVQYDSSARNSVTLGGANAPAPVKLTNLKDADLSASSTDAVTGRQLYATNVEVANLDQALKNLDLGGSKYVAVQTANGVATASAASTVAVGGGASASADASTAIGDKARAGAKNSVALGANSVADRDNSVSVGSAGGERQIANVAAGTAPTDAVNLGQLNGAVNGLNGRVGDVDRNARRGIAAASALNIVTPYLPGRTTLNAGVAGYRGQAALGIGVSRWNEKGTINYNLGVSSAGSNSTIVRAGIGIVFGG